MERVAWKGSLEEVLEERKINGSLWGRMGENPRDSISSPLLPLEHDTGYIHLFLKPRR